MLSSTVSMTGDTQATSMLPLDRASRLAPSQRTCPDGMLPMLELLQATSMAQGTGTHHGKCRQGKGR